jgi:chemosensory pili system protein ChpA (sensor histidine kinase/response regulator)
VRQACVDTQKSAELVVEGEQSELDRQVLESMLPPFEHLLRNAIAHGIEACHPRKARQAGRAKCCSRFAAKAPKSSSVADDGGLDLAAIRRKALKGCSRTRITGEQAVELIRSRGSARGG